MADSLLSPSATIYIAGHRGLAGSAIWRALQRHGYTHLVGASSADVDLRDRAATMAFMRRTAPDAVVLAAAKVGGIGANSAYPVDFLSDNLRIQTNVLDAAHESGVGRLVFLGSSCIYPKFAPQPISEDALLTGPLEPTNDAYAIAKISGIIGVQAYRRQYGHSWVSVMPTNLYGPGDNFDQENSHVLPALMRRFHEAARDGAESVTLWGTGTPRREFLHVDDLGEAVVHVLRTYDDPSPLNVGTGRDVTIAELGQLMADVVGYEGTVAFDPSRPDGTPRKQLDIDRIVRTGWQPKISLKDGITETYAWYRETYGP